MLSEFHPEFAEDLEEAARFLEKEETGLGGRFLDAVEAACQRVIANPLHFSYIDKPVRRIQTQIFPYSIHYEVIDESTIYFYGCYHQAMNPQRWETRH
ncbi:MAG: type II toxin-antitoxin system RelE/ParE family toxin [Verrucomicrobiota bacterium]